ncbi:MAG TPA: hypothetical protein VGD35_02330, partial [Chitinophaga sp.]
KVRRTGLRLYRKAVLAGHTVYRMSAILPEELSGKGYAKQFFAAFHPGSKERKDTRNLGQEKLDLLLKDLQSTDSAAFHGAFAYMDHLVPDSADIGAILGVLTKPIPADTGDNNVKVKLLQSLKKLANDSVVHAAEMLFTGTPDLGRRKNILRFLNGLETDTAMHTFLRLGPQLQESTASWGVFDYHFKKNDSLYQQYLPDIIAAAEGSPAFLQAFAGYTAGDSIWLSPYFEKYKLERRVPGPVQLFARDIQKWKKRQPESDSNWRRQSSLQNIGYILALPGMPASTVPSFRELLADTTMPLRALGARGLINQNIKVNDIVLKTILIDNSNAWSFISAIKNRNQLQHIRHLLSQDIIGRSYVGNILSEDYELTALEQLSRVKVQQGDLPAVWLTLYRYKTDESEDWEYILNGPQPLDQKKLNFEPDLTHWFSEEEDVTDKKQLAAIAEEAYKNYLEEQKGEEGEN